MENVKIHVQMVIIKIKINAKDALQLVKNVPIKTNVHPVLMDISYSTILVCHHVPRICLVTVINVSVLSATHLAIPVTEPQTVNVLLVVKTISETINHVLVHKTVC